MGLRHCLGTFSFPDSNKQPQWNSASELVTLSREPQSYVNRLCLHQSSVYPCCARLALYDHRLTLPLFTRSEIDMFREALLRLEQVAGPLSPRAFESHDVPAEEVPIVGRVISITLSLITLSVIAICLSRRIPITQRWKKLPITSWIIIITYVDSFIFVFLSAIIKDLGVNNSLSLCQGAILLCLSFSSPTRKDYLANPTSQACHAI